MKKKKAHAVLTAVGVPLARFEADVEALRVVPPNHGLLQLTGEMMTRGLEFKKAANYVMQSGGALEVTTAEASSWAAEVRATTTALKAATKLKRT